MTSVEALQDIQESMDDQSIIFCYSGYMTDDILVSIGASVRQELEMTNVDRSSSRAIFAIFVEGVQNVIRYSAGLLFDAMVSSAAYRWLRAVEGLIARLRDR